MNTSNHTAMRHLMHALVCLAAAWILFPAGAALGTVAPPRICVAVKDQWRQGPDKGWQEDSSTTLAAIASYFGKQNPDIRFVDLGLLAKDGDGDADFVCLARRRAFDILILGVTRGTLMTAPGAVHTNPWTMTAGDVMLGGRRYAFSYRAEWRIVDAATSEVVAVVERNFLPTGDYGGDRSHDLDSARAWAREHLFAQANPELYDRVTAWWNTTGSKRPRRSRVAAGGAAAGGQGQSASAAAAVPGGAAEQGGRNAPAAGSQGPDTEPPRITLVKPQVGRGTVLTIKKPGEPLEVEGVVKDPSGIHSLLVNGTEVQVSQAGFFKARVTPEEGERRLVITAVDNEGNVATRDFILGAQRQDRSAGPQVKGAKPALWGLAIGVSDYADSNIDLRFADRDAESVARFFEQNGKEIFSEVHFKTLLNQDATREKIIDAMSRHLGQAGIDDMVLIFIAGHGVRHRQSGSYYFLTHDADFDTILSRGLRMSDFDEAVKILKQNVGKVVVAMDTCHSGAMQVGTRGAEGGEDLAEALRSSSGLFILAASKGGEPSLEDASYSLDGDGGHGVFTYSLISALKGKANYDGDGYVTINEVFQYVAKQVPRLTEGRQHPYFRVEGTDLPLARTGEGGK